MAASCAGYFFHSLSIFGLVLEGAILCVTYTVFRRKTPTHVYFYISMENVSISRRFSGNV